MKQTALSITAIAVSLIAIVVSFTNMPKAEPVTPDQLTELRKIVDTRETNNMDRHRSQNQAIMNLISDVEKLKAASKQ